MQLNLKPNLIRVRLNEMPFNLPIWLRIKITVSTFFIKYNRYPDLNYTKLIENISCHEEVSKEEILVGAGSSGLISLLILYFHLMSRQLVLENPSFIYYSDFSKAFNIPTKTLSLKQENSYGYNSKRFEEFENNSVIFLTSPNNPLGLCISYDFLENQLKTWPNRTYVVDSAYADFTQENYVTLIKKFSNLIIIKTFSKGSLTASIRVGYLLTSTSLIKILKTKITPWSVSEGSSVVANLILKSVQNSKYFSNKINYVAAERDKIIKSFSGIDWIKIQTGQKGNSVFFEILDSEKFSQFTKQMTENNFLVKVYQDFFGKPAIRYAVSYKKINNKFIKIIKNI